LNALLQSYGIKIAEMKNLFILCFAAMSFTKWEPNFEVAKKKATEKHQLILLNFSGSDWCGPCMRMRKEIFNSDVFSKMADSTLLMVNADFPRKKKNQLDKMLQKQNDALAEKYNPQGKFPYTVLIDATGKLIKAWDGLPKDKAEQFAQQVKIICNANK
jgi:thioredoxin-related protein